MPTIDESCVDQSLSFDDLYRTIAADLARLDPEVALTTRYLSLSNRFSAGVCADASLDADRQALFELVNALSTESAITQPVAIDADRTIFRINLADYGWDEPVTVVNSDGSTNSFTDKWEAIVAGNPYALPAVGDDADDAANDSGTRVPVMLADAALDVATIGNLYYALIGVDVRNTLDDFILDELGIDVVQNIIDEEQVRAGTTASRISRQDRLVQRDDIEIRAGALWQAYDFAEGSNASIFEDPFGFSSDGRVAMFTLPNGFFGFAIADENSAIVEDSDILLDTNQNNFRAIASVSCSNCHARGVLPVVDEVREVLLANAREIGLNRDEVEQLQAVFIEPTAFAAVAEADNAIYRGALTAAGLPTAGSDPVSGVVFRFDQDVDLADVAGDLGVSPQVVIDNIDLLDPALSVLAAGGLIDRDDFSALYAATACILRVVDESAVDPAFCDALEAALR